MRGSEPGHRRHVALQLQRRQRRGRPVQHGRRQTRHEHSRRGGCGCGCIHIGGCGGERSGGGGCGSHSGQHRDDGVRGGVCVQMWWRRATKVFSRQCGLQRLCSYECQGARGKSGWGKGAEGRATHNGAQARSKHSNQQTHTQRATRRTSCAIGRRISQRAELRSPIRILQRLASAPLCSIVAAATA